MTITTRPQQNRNSDRLSSAMRTSRRSFLRDSSFAAASLLAGCAGTLRQCQEQIAQRPTRRNIADMAPNDPVLLAFRSAIQQMRALPTTDPRNWTRQARIHLDHCPHGNWLLLPWHRAYLYYFENICRKLSGMSDFALPYWDWSTQSTIPPVYWDAASPLFHPGRAATSSSTVDTGSVGPAELNTILNEANFLVFASGSILATDDQRTHSTYGPLEATPHNYIHGFLGGDMATFMSPLDPIFWSHHAMIDRCWVDWNLVRNHPNTSDSAWSNRKFTEFCDENGNPVEVEAVTTVVMPILSYQYDAPIGGSPAAPAARIASDQRARQEELAAEVKAGALVRLETLAKTTAQPRPIDLDHPGSVPLIRPADARATRTLLTLEGASTNHTLDFFVRIFVNRPDATAATPASDPNLLATFAFFSHDRGAASVGSFVFDATEALYRLARFGEEATFTFVLVPHEDRTPATRSFSPGVVSLRSVKDIVQRQ